MLIALDSDNKRISAKEAPKGAEYRCSACGEKVELRKGEVRIPHFAHWKNSECIDSWRHDMSEWHYTWQDMFPIDCQEIVVENDGEKHRADVLIENHKIVIEFQHSRIKPEEFEERNTFYHKCGYHIIWLFDMSADFNDGKFVFREDSNCYIWKRPWTTFRVNTNHSSYWQHNWNDVSVFFEHNGVIDKLIEYNSDNKTVKLSGLSDSYNFSINTFLMWLKNNFSSEDLRAPYCKKCKERMELRRYRVTQDYFWGCVNFSSKDCREREDIGLLPSRLSLNGHCPFCDGNFTFAGLHVECSKCGFTVQFNIK